MTTGKEIYKQTYTEEDWPGLDAIQKKLNQIYGNQEPTHFANLVPDESDGEDPLWAVEFFINEKQQKHLHYITLGFTNLFYDEEYVEEEVNGFGFELTFRILPAGDDQDKPQWPANLLKNLATYVFNSQNVFDEYHFMSANGPLRADTDTEITAMAFCIDPEMGELDTVHGHTKFLQVFGITTTEYNELTEGKYSVKQLLDKHRIINPLLITDLARK